MISVVILGVVGFGCIAALVGMFVLHLRDILANQREVRRLRRLWRIQRLERECGIEQSDCLWADLCDPS